MKLLSAILLLIPAVMAGCDHRSRHFEKRAKASFGYGRNTGPMVWHSLSEANMPCAMGRNQSPINIRDNNTVSRSGRSLVFSVDSYPNGAALENLGTTLEVPANGTLQNGNKSYSLLQFHFHTPSEHRINDEFYPLEVHFVFEASDDSLTVVGFPIEVATKSDQWLSNVFKYMESNTTSGDEFHTGPLDFTGLGKFISSNRVYQYSGSLTTPPCSEGVAWNVVARPISIDMATYRKVKKTLGYNSRYTQSDPGQMNELQASCNYMVS